MTRSWKARSVEELATGRLLSHAPTFRLCDAHQELLKITPLEETSCFVRSSVYIEEVHNT